jgi:hypothetical protein
MDPFQTTTRTKYKDAVIRGIHKIMLPVFPLPIFLLPQGVTRLRIFEPRYIKMVKSCAGSQPFALSLYRKEAEQLSSDWAAEVEIIDFETLEDGLLGITVKANRLIGLSDFERDDDNLLFANTTELAHWPEIADDDPNPILAEKLKGIMAEHSVLGELYPKAQFDSARWVNSRWLELLPMNYELKQQFTQADSFSPATKFIKTIVLDEQFDN